MSRNCRCFVALSGLLIGSAVLVCLAPSIVAQPPGPAFDKSKENAQSKEKSVEKKGEKSTVSPDEQLKNLEADLAKLKALEKELQSKIEKLKESPEPSREPSPSPKEGTSRNRNGGAALEDPGRGFPDRFGPPGRGGSPFGMERGGFGPPGLNRGTEFQRFAGQGMSLIVSRMVNSISAEQLKELIDELEKLRAEKLRAAPPQPREKEQPRSREGARNPSIPPAPPRNEEILKRLDKLSRELEEIRNSLKK